ncbi:hypothetical protein ACN47E_008557 [Coniothyrium glycines]
MESRHGFEYIHRLLQSQSHEVAIQIFERIRQGSDIGSIIRFVQYGALRQHLSLVARPSACFASSYIDDVLPLLPREDNPYLGSKLHDFVVGVPNTSSGSPLTDRPPHDEASLHIPFPGARLYDERFANETLSLSRWTSISSDEHFLHGLLEAYFVYEFPFWPCLHMETFLEDLAAGSQENCSSFLINVILTAGCHSLSALEQRAEAWNPKTFSYQFLAESRRQWEIEQSRTEPCMTTVQAASILGRLYFTNGMDSVGWSIWTQALVMAKRLGLYSDVPETMSERQRSAQIMAVWGLFSQQAFSCFYIMKPPLILELPMVPLPDPALSPEFYNEIRVTHPSFQYPVSMAFGQTFFALIQLRRIMHDITRSVRPPHGRPSFDVDHAKHCQILLKEWYDALPDVLQAKNVTLPNQLQLHMQYHNLVTMVFRPFIMNEATAATTDASGTFEDRAGFNPLELVTSAKASLQILLRLFYHRYGFEGYHIFMLQILGQLGFEAIERLRELDSTQKGSSAEGKALRATLLLCAKGLDDQGQNFHLSECVSRILRDNMSEGDIAILHEWAPRKDDENREPLAKDSVYSEYPVNIVSITQDPSDRRLCRILGNRPHSPLHSKARGELQEHCSDCTQAMCAAKKCTQ